jgi:hypothetical protein
MNKNTSLFRLITSGKEKKFFIALKIGDNVLKLFVRNLRIFVQAGVLVRLRWKSLLVTNTQAYY